jgi:hypothetical protein
MTAYRLRDCLANMERKATKREAARLQKTIVVIVEAAENGRTGVRSSRQAKSASERDTPCGLSHARRRWVFCSSLRKVEATTANKAD